MNERMWQVEEVSWYLICAFVVRIIFWFSIFHLLYESFFDSQSFICCTNHFLILNLSFVCTNHFLIFNLSFVVRIIFWFSIFHLLYESFFDFQSFICCTNHFLIFNLSFVVRIIFWFSISHLLYESFFDSQSFICCTNHFLILNLSYVVRIIFWFSIFHSLCEILFGSQSFYVPISKNSVFVSQQIRPYYRYLFLKFVLIVIWKWIWFFVCEWMWMFKKLIIFSIILNIRCSLFAFLSQWNYCILFWFLVRN